MGRLIKPVLLKLGEWLCLYILDPLADWLDYSLSWAIHPRHKYTYKLNEYLQKKVYNTGNWLIFPIILLHVMTMTVSLFTLMPFEAIFLRKRRRAELFRERIENG